jgi:hypothetical protein
MHVTDSAIVPVSHADEGDWYPGTYPYQPHWPSVGIATSVTPAQQSCSAETHVFPCPHCNTCKCGKATIER